jgi:hypothetical protein
MIVQNIKRRAGVSYRSGNWWTNALINELITYQTKNINESDTGFIVPGDLVFFLYSAKYPQKYEYWDQHPLTYIIEVNPREGKFFGSNLHYLNPQYRGGYAKSYLNKGGIVNAPKKTLHNYLFSGVVSDLYKVPKEEWVGVSLLPTEKFVNSRGQSVPKYRVWDAP